MPGLVARPVFHQSWQANLNELGGLMSRVAPLAFFSIAALLGSCSSVYYKTLEKFGKEPQAGSCQLASRR
jgi:hypothetical protein